MLALFAFALIWLAVALGLAAKSVETASNTPMFLILLPFLGSGFVPTATMPDGLRQFAEYQPFTSVADTVRGLLTGPPSATMPSSPSRGASASPRLLSLGHPPVQPAPSGKPGVTVVCVPAPAHGHPGR